MIRNMAYKDPEDQRKYARKHYLDNKELYKARAVKHNRATHARVRELVLKAKDIPCADCDMKYPSYVMQFDHLDPDGKLFNIANWSGKRYSVARVLLEIAKCEVVCANCHAIRTYTRRSGTGI